MTGETFFLVRNQELSQKLTLFQQNLKNDHVPPKFEAIFHILLEHGHIYFLMEHGRFSNFCGAWSLLKFFDGAWSLLKFFDGAWSLLKFFFVEHGRFSNFSMEHGRFSNFCGLRTSVPPEFEK